MFVNVSNHPSSKWSAVQMEAARALGGGMIVDIQFPNVPPRANQDDLEAIAARVVEESHASSGGCEPVFHIMGESTLTHLLVMRLHAAGFRVVASTTERVSVENADGSKTLQFSFVQFRDYPRS